MFSILKRLYMPITAQSWANVVGGGGGSGESPPASQEASADMSAVLATYNSELCPYYMMNQRCGYSEHSCPYIHGLLCEICQLAVLHPHNERQRKEHAVVSGISA